MEIKEKTLKKEKKEKLEKTEMNKKVETYKINTDTLAIMPINRKKTKIYETDNVIIINRNAKSIIQENCQFFGSSYAGRKQGTLEMTGITHKPPICIEETNDLIFFPTSSPRLNDCCWISLNQIESFEPYDDEAIIRFQNNVALHVEVSTKVINNQVLRATRLESVIHKRRSQEMRKENRKK